MAGNWQNNSRFGQFADPNFGKSLYANKPDPMAQGTNYGYDVPMPKGMPDSTAPGAIPDDDGAPDDATPPAWFEGGGMVGEEPAPSKIKSALAFGRQQHGLPVDWFNHGGPVSYAEGGPVEGGVVDDGAGGAQTAMAYLTGEGALDPAVVQQIESQFAGGSPTQAKYSAVENAPDEQTAFGLLQHYRKRFNAYSAFAQAAMTGNQEVGKPPNPMAAARAATQAFENIPDGNEVQFRPTEQGIEVSFRPIIPSKPAPSGGEKPPPFGMAAAYGPTNRPMIPTMPAPSGGEKPAPTAMGEEEDDTLYAAEGGVIPGEDEEEIYTGSTGDQQIPMSPDGQMEMDRLQQGMARPGSPIYNMTEQGIQQREAAEFPQGDGSMPMPRPRAMRPGEGALGPEQQWQEHGEGIRKFLLNTAQFLGFLRESGQMDSVLDQGMDKAVAAALSKEQAPQWAGEQGAQYQGHDTLQSAEQPAPPQGTPSTTQKPRDTIGMGDQGDYLDPRNYAAYSKANQDSLNSRTNAGADEDDLRRRALRMFPMVSQGQQAEQWIEQQRGGRQAQADKERIEHIKGDYGTRKVETQQENANYRAQLNADARRYAADQRITGINLTTEATRARVEMATKIKYQIEALRQAAMDARQRDTAIAGVLKTALANSPGLIRDPEEQKQFIAGVMAGLPPQNSPATQAMQQAPAQAPAPQQQQQQGMQPPPEFMERVKALKPGKGLEIPGVGTWANVNGVPTKVK